MAAEPSEGSTFVRDLLNIIASLEFVYDRQLEKKGYDPDKLRIEYGKKITSGSASVTLFEDEKFVEDVSPHRREHFKKDRSLEIQADFGKLLKEYPEIIDPIIVSYTTKKIPCGHGNCQICAMIDDFKELDIYVVIYIDVNENILKVKYISLYHGYGQDGSEYYLHSKWELDIDDTLENVLEQMPGLVENIKERFGVEILMRTLKSLI